jgi:glycosyltransferase involved in cell wall biosynthesis
MDLVTITPLVLTWNEEANLERCLERLGWAKRVLVVDSGSSDGTLAICAQFANVEVVHREFDDHTSQWNFGVDLVETEWVFALDADYLVPSEMPKELADLDEDGVAAWYAKFRYCISGQPLRGSLYPPRAVLFRKSSCRYANDGHTQCLHISGASGFLKTRINHDDRKPLSRWLDSQRKYAALEADKLLAAPPRSLPDRLRRMIWPAAPAAFLYTLFAKGLILDGWPGLHYALQRAVAEAILSMEMISRRA